jgi:hypothetical protein
MLSNLEIGEHVDSIVKNIEILGSTLISDPVLTNYLVQLTARNAAFSEGLMPPKKSDETAKIAKADEKRDIATRMLFQQLKVYKYVENPLEQEAYASLKNIFNTYRGIHRWNFEKQTAGMDNLLTSLQEPVYVAHLDWLDMTAKVARLTTANEAFKAAFNKRMQEKISTPSYDMKQLRKEMQQTYEDTINYVLAMAKAHDTEQFNKTLEVINLLRDYYGNLIAKRLGMKGKEVH